MPSNRSIILDIITRADTGGLDNMRRSIQLFGTAAFLRAGGRALRDMGQAGIDFSINAARAAAEFDRGMRLVQTQADLSGKDMKKLEQNTLELARTVTPALGDLNTTLFDLFSSIDFGKDPVAEASAALKLLAQAATAGQAPLESTGRGVIAMLNAMGMKTTPENFSKVLDVQFQLVKKGVGTYEEFSKALGDVLPVTKQTRQSLSTMAAAMAFATRNGLNASRAGTSVARSFQLLSRPESIKGLKEILGVNVVDKKGQFRDFNDVLEDMGRKMEKLTAPERVKILQDIFGKQRPVAIRFIQTATENYRALDLMQREVADSNGAMQAAFNEMDASPAVQMEKAMNNFRVAVVKLGQELIPVFAQVVRYFSLAVDWFQKLSPETRHNIAMLLLFGSAISAASGMVLIFGSHLAQMGSLLLLVRAQGEREIPTLVRQRAAQIQLTKAKLAEAKANAALAATRVAAAEAQMVELAGTNMEFIAVEELNAAKAQQVIANEAVAASELEVASAQRMVTTQSSGMLASIAPFLIAVAVLAALAGAFYLAWTRSEKFREAITKIVDNLKVLWQTFLANLQRIKPEWDAFVRALIGTATAVGERIGSIFKKVVDNFGPFLVKFVPQVLRVVGVAARVVMQMIRLLMPVIEWLIGTTLTLIRGVIETIAHMFNGVIHAINGLIRAYNLLPGHKDVGTVGTIDVNSLFNMPKAQIGTTHSAADVREAESRSEIPTSMRGGSERYAGAAHGGVTTRRLRLHSGGPEVGEFGVREGIIPFNEEGTRILAGALSKAMEDVGMGGGATIHNEFHQVMPDAKAIGDELDWIHRKNGW